MAQDTNSSTDKEIPFTIPPATLAVFQSSPWTASLISKSDYRPIETSARVKKPLGEDAFFAETIATPTTIPHCLSLQRRNPSPPPSEAPFLPPPPAKWPKIATPPDLITLWDFGNPGISGHPNTAHGGVLSTLIDEMMSVAIAMHIPGYTFNEATERGRIYTLQLDVRFRNPVYVPGLAVLKVWCIAKVGRKFWLRAQILQEEGLGEQNGGAQPLEWAKKKVVCVEAMGFFVQTTNEKL
ncbi:thioesterase [Coccidioides immitis RS]|uniref:Thioesterase n=3 Tax=Coccidioides immitis TaxID=5501 RepID=A0A0E1RUY5_COCIM|nr:thioesterase [Coccidioides immitis RS]EAS28759.1 thioesterase [Coccidioides immitis RS]KMP05864.1 hypothetical protein CIRG_05545 [Coccidioides immitis RMSCC 2394]KMU80705.1 hypothetical protein CISG_08769 [Coccidioides immitis RMSCC 3703]TPX23062.1 hypothetical protein DIZ76_014944 [Coccidioides immitis]